MFHISSILKLKISIANRSFIKNLYSYLNLVLKTHPTLPFSN